MAKHRKQKSEAEIRSAYDGLLKQVNERPRTMPKEQLREKQRILNVLGWCLGEAELPDLDTSTDQPAIVPAEPK